MITVHHLNNSRSQRILWLLEELGVVVPLAGSLPNDTPKRPLPRSALV